MKSILPLFIFILLFALMSSSIAQVDWTKYPGNPVLVPGNSGTWSENSLMPACVLYDGTAYHIWYGGHDGTNARIGYAYSSDGLIWEKYEGNPVLDVGSPGTWDDERISDPYVLFDGSIYHMWYGGYDGENYSIGYATSPDSITWTKYAGNPVMVRGQAGTWNEKHVLGPCVRIDGSTYHMWFCGENEDYRQCIGYATSSDGISWTPFAGNPVLTPSPAPAWDQQIVQGPEVFYDGNSYHMWFSGKNTPAWWQGQIGYATAPDETTWIKYEDNPVLTPTAGSWDSQSVGYCSVLLDTATNQFKMWYGGGEGEWNGKYGYATAPDCTVTAIYNIDNIFIPAGYSLQQNYPNPFNPSTKIEFALPKSEFVELKVYNILGEEISTLVSKNLNQGNYTYTFNGKNLVSGVYYYQLVAGEYMEVKKMILLK